jgi:hypothetical protein
MLVVQLPSWDLYQDWEEGPSLVKTKFRRAIQYAPLDNGQPENERMLRLKRRDPEKFKVEREAQFAEVIDAYLDTEKVDAMFEPFWGGRILEEQDLGRIGFLYEGHADPGRTNANFAFAIAHLEQSPEPDEHGYHWHHVIFDKLVVWSPSNYDDHTIDYVEVSEDLHDLSDKFFTLNRMTFDQWNSAGFLASLKKHVKAKGYATRVLQVNFTKGGNITRAEQFKSALNLGWVHSYKDTFFSDGGSLLEQELKFLQEKNGQVVKQSIGPVTTKDLSDCVMEVTTRLLKDQHERWQRALLGDLVPATGLQSGYPESNAGYADGGFMNEYGARPNSARATSNREKLKSYRRGGDFSSNPTRGRNL